MTKKFCDRCGKKIPELCTLSNAIFPIYRFQETIGPGVTFDLDLCQNCIKSFENWLVSCEKEDNDVSESL